MSDMPDDVAEKLMAYADGELVEAEVVEFEKLLEQHPEWRSEVAGMKSLVDATQALAFRPPAPETWDGYWEEIDSRLAPRFGWVLLAIGGLILTVLGIFKAMILTDNLWVKGSIALIVAGFLTLFLSVLRGHLLERPRDRYRRIRR